MTKRFVNTLIATLTAINRHAGAASAWTSVGSTGTPDESSNPTLSGSVVSAGSEVNRVHMRYGVTETQALGSGVGMSLSIRYYDSDADGAEVKAYLVQSDLQTGGGATLLRLTSNDSDPAFTEKVLAASRCDTTFDFDRYAYYVYAALDKRVEDPAAKAYLRSMRLDSTPMSCIPH